jgi:hypothetical protein
MHIEFKEMLPQSSTCDHEHIEFFVPNELPPVGQEFGVTVNCMARECGATATRSIVSA